MSRHDFARAPTVLAEPVESSDNSWIPKPNKPGFYLVRSSKAMSLASAQLVQIKGSRPDNFHYDEITPSGQPWARFIKHLDENSCLLFYGPIPPT